MDDDFPALMRAARAYAGISQETLAERLGVEAQWIKRREKGVQATKEMDRLAIAAACDVRFVDHGFVAAGAAIPSAGLPEISAGIRRGVDERERVQGRPAGSRSPVAHPKPGRSGSGSR